MQACAYSSSSGQLYRVHTSFLCSAWAFISGCRARSADRASSAACDAHDSVSDSANDPGHVSDRLLKRCPYNPVTAGKPKSLTQQRSSAASERPFHGVLVLY